MRTCIVYRTQARGLKDQQERIVKELEEKLKRPSGNMNAADFYNTGILDSIETVKNS